MENRMENSFVSVLGQRSRLYFKSTGVLLRAGLRQPLATVLNPPFQSWEPLLGVQGVVGFLSGVLFGLLMLPKFRMLGLGLSGPAALLDAVLSVVLASYLLAGLLAGVSFLALEAQRARKEEMAPSDGVAATTGVEANRPSFFHLYSMAAVCSLIYSGGLALSGTSALLPVLGLLAAVGLFVKALTRLSVESKWAQAASLVLALLVLIGSHGFTALAILRTWPVN